MSKLTTIGVDLAKNVFHLIGVDQRNKEILKRQLRRSQMLRYFANVERCTVVMEACSGSHYWGRELMKLGHGVMLIPAQHVRAYRQGQRNDYNDARAILEASGRSQVRTVRVKTVEEQDIQSLGRLRQQLIKTRSRLCLTIRGLLAENGIVLSKGLSRLRRVIPELLEDGENGLSAGFRRLLSRQYEMLKRLDEEEGFYAQEVRRVITGDAGCRRLLKVPGYGPIVALHYRTAIGDGAHLARGRDAAVVMGLTPGHHGTGGRNRVGSITKCGDRHLRSLLVHGARAVVSRASGKTDDLSVWIRQLEARVGRNKATVALANKMARVGWAILRYGVDYDPAMMSRSNVKAT